MLGAQQIPKELDWVSERSKCAAFEIFVQLRIEVEKDVATRQALEPPDHHSFKTEFTFRNSSSDIFCVLRGGMRKPSVVQFRLEGESIAVRDESNKTVMRATLGLNELGECILRLEDNIELRTWQFRHKALEKLFFGT